MAILAAAACLLDKLALTLHFIEYRFTIRDFGLPYADVYLHVTGKFVFKYFQMQFAHTTDDSFTRFRVEFAAKRRVLAPERVQGLGELGSVICRPGLYGH